MLDLFPHYEVVTEDVIGVAVPFQMPLFRIVAESIELASVCG